MTSLHDDFARVFYRVEYLLIYYVAAINALYMALITVGFFSLQRFSDRIFLAELDTLMNSSLLPGIAVIAPAYNEELSVRDSVRSMLNLRYPAARPAAPSRRSACAPSMNRAIP
jgi:cellulose synthase/poly-beta-1,6-N-acetylglucosamine synthase-like glycosyltransferase